MAKKVKLNTDPAWVKHLATLDDGTPCSAGWREPELEEFIQDEAKHKEYMIKQEALDKQKADLRTKLNELEPDKCKFCLGIKGGVLGNENVVDGVVVCDYCTSILMDMEKSRNAK